MTSILVPVMAAICVAVPVMAVILHVMDRGGGDD